MALSAAQEKVYNWLETAEGTHSFRNDSDQSILARFVLFNQAFLLKERTINLLMHDATAVTEGKSNTSKPIMTALVAAHALAGKKATITAPFSIVVAATSQVTATNVNSGTITYSSSNDKVATVSATGLVTGVSAGTVTISATVAETATHYGQSVSVVGTITA